MLILLPASDSKAPVQRGKPLDLAALSFPPLTATRTSVLEALIAVSAEPDATRRLCEKPSQSDAVLRNRDLRDAPAAPAEAIYSGVLHDALALAGLDAASRRRARAWIVIISALWGAVRPGDRIPSYRLNMCGRLPGLAHLPDVWREPLDTVLPAAAGRGLIVDFRSSEYATAWRPRGPLAERAVVVKVVRDLDTNRGAGAHHAKRTRGLLVRRIVTAAIDSRDPEGLTEALAEHFDVGLHHPDRPGRAWNLHVLESLD